MARGPHVYKSDSNPNPHLDTDTKGYSGCNANTDSICHSHADCNGDTHSFSHALDDTIALAVIHTPTANAHDSASDTNTTASQQVSSST